MSKLDSEMTDWGDNSLMMMAGFRYCLGRMTYMSQVCARWIVRNWSKMPDNIRGLIKRELEEEFARDDADRKEGRDHRALGHDCDRAEWEMVRNLWRGE